MGEKEKNELIMKIRKVCKRYDYCLIENIPTIHLTPTDQKALEVGLLVDVSDLNLRINDVLIDRVSEKIWDKFREDKKAIFNTIDSVLKNKQYHIDYGDGDYGKYCEPQWFMVLINEENIGRMWCCQNERGNLTLMFPEDY
jgi:hypothetical protein